MRRTEAMLRRNDLNREFEMLSAKEEGLRSQIRNLVVEACELRRQQMEIEAEIAALDMIISHAA